ncbi:hypothetical protein H5410_026427 [Solanum commersonii]|uniref:Uncharacterized protein n=1 Tax=Solanum commersonii TaxID=4109 RepID=A0A9J5YYZ7_SOLCO|nr:hypothetical protein H5410_026427 [Solanum commersonii]
MVTGRICDCQTSQDCGFLKCQDALGTCVGGVCVCLAHSNTYSTNHEEGIMEECPNPCQSREECDFLKCEMGFPTCVDGNCKIFSV